jgi:hypothetical protein
MEHCDTGKKPADWIDARFRSSQGDHTTWCLDNAVPAMIHSARQLEGFYTIATGVKKVSVVPVRNEGFLEEMRS